MTNPHFEAWINGTSEGAQLCTRLLDLTGDPVTARAVAEIAFAEGCVAGAYATQRTVEATLGQAGAA